MGSKAAIVARIREELTLIVSRILGGLGSQMLCYAAGFSLARLRGVPFVMDLRSVGLRKDRPYLLDRLCIGAETATRQQIADAKSSQIAAYDPSKPFDASFFDLPSSCYLDGERFSYKYHAGYEDQLKREFSLRKPIHGEVFDVGIHIRRGTS